MKILWALSAFVLSQAAAESEVQTDWDKFLNAWQSLNCSYPPGNYLETALKDICSTSIRSEASVEGNVCFTAKSYVLKICNASKGDPSVVSLFPHEKGDMVSFSGSFHFAAYA